MRITILGGHGRVALLTAPLLTQRGHEVLSVIRNPDHAADVAETGAIPVVADIETTDEAAMAALLHSSNAVVWSAGAGGGDPQRTVAVDRDAAIRSMTAAERAGVRRYVMVSYIDSGRDSTPADHPFRTYADAKAAADEHLAGTQLDWTVVAPGALGEADPIGAIELDPADSRSGQVSRADVAQVVAQAVQRGDLSGVTLRFLAGDQPIAEALDSAATTP